jgi:hypothetical protein
VCAVPRPMPELEPVMSAVFPCNDMMRLLSLVDILLLRGRWPVRDT